MSLCRASPAERKGCVRGHIPGCHSSVTRSGHSLIHLAQYALLGRETMSWDRGPPFGAVAGRTEVVQRSNPTPLKYRAIVEEGRLSACALGEWVKGRSTASPAALKHLGHPDKFR